MLYSGSLLVILFYSFITSLIVYFRRGIISVASGEVLFHTLQAPSKENKLISESPCHLLFSCLVVSDSFVTP